MFTYLLLNVFTIIFPLTRSFEPKIHYVGKWWALLRAIVITGTFFIIWDHYFTQWHIWAFNPTYIMGIYLFSLPIEEWLFFFSVPFACVFIYEVLKYFLPKDPFRAFSSAITGFILFIFLLVACLNYDRLYTLTCFALATVFLVLHLLLFKRRYLGMFYLTYLVHLVPFLIIDGILTSLPVVVYDSSEILNIRIFSIPIEDTVYSFLLLLMNISFYEYFLNKKIKQFP